MRVTSIIDNISHSGLPVEHALSLFIHKEDGQGVLFDMGQGELFVRNAEALSLSVADVDVAVVSHGHYDHGGGLRSFLSENQKAKVYINNDAFLPHYSLRDSSLSYIGLDKSLQHSERVVPCGDLSLINGGMTLFANVQGSCCNPTGNRLLFGPEEKENDNFRHEQNLIIEEGGKAVLFAGCAHRGIVNIIRKARDIIGKAPAYVFAGMHLVKSGLNEREEAEFIELLASELMRYSDTMFYTMHCTGEEQYAMLKSLMGDQIEYLACGDSRYLSL